MRYRLPVGCLSLCRWRPPADARAVTSPSGGPERAQGPSRALVRALRALRAQCLARARRLFLCLRCRRLVPPPRRSCASTAEVSRPHLRGRCVPTRRSCASSAEVLCLHRRGLVPPLRRSCASTTEVLCLHCRGLAPPPQRALCPWSDAALVPQPIGSTFSRCSHGVAVAPQSRYQSRDY